MEWMYQAFKARMEAEAKADYEREMRMSKDSVTTPTAQALATIKDSLEYICNDESLQPIQAARNALKALSVLTAALEPRQQSQDERNWTEDFSHENGNYQCKCFKCEQFFIGHKRRVVCKLCAAPQAQPSAMKPATYWKNEFASDYEGTFDDHVLKTIELIQQDAINCRLDLSEESIAVGKAMSRFFNKNEEIHREAFIDNLCMLIARLAHRLKANKEHVDDDKLAAEAMQFLRCNGRNGSPLRQDAIRSVKEGGE